MEQKSLFGAVEPKVMAAIADRAREIADGDRPTDLIKAAVALGSVPIVLGALAASAPAQAASDSAVSVLQYAFLLENLENEFYRGVTGVAGSPFANAFATVRGKFAGVAGVGSTIMPTLNLLAQHETAHVNLLRTVLQQFGVTTTYDPAQTFDFTGGRKVGGDPNGAFYPATQDVNFLLAGTQGFEDTGVRAYKGQAGVLLSTANGLKYLTTALQIHAVEARHAARIRRLRRLITPTATDIRYSGTIKGASAGGTLPSNVQAAFAAIYAGEDNTKHTVNNGSNVTIDAAGLSGLPAGTDVTLAFDEPLGAVAVGAIVQNFIIPTVTLPPGLA
jgi:hypothetical protein